MATHTRITKYLECYTYRIVYNCDYLILRRIHDQSYLLTGFNQLAIKDIGLYFELLNCVKKSILYGKITLFPKKDCFKTRFLTIY